MDVGGAVRSATPERGPGHALLLLLETVLPHIVNRRSAGEKKKKIALADVGGKRRRVYLCLHRRQEIGFGL